MNPKVKRMFELGREILALAVTLPINEFDGWYYFFASTWGRLYQAKQLGELDELLKQFGNEEFWDMNMRVRLRRFGPSTEE